jgi:hypothetical protein
MSSYNYENNNMDELKRYIKESLNLVYTTS